MIRTDAQTCRALRVLLARVNLQDLWTNQGPTDRASSLLEVDRGALAPSERVLLLAAWSIWNGTGDLPFAELLRLDGGHLESLCSLLVALSRGAVTIEAWIESPEARCVRSPGGHCARAECVDAPASSARRSSRVHSDRPWCVCTCGDCAQARWVEDRIARRATRETTKIRR